MTTEIGPTMSHPIDPRYLPAAKLIADELMATAFGRPTTVTVPTSSFGVGDCPLSKRVDGPLHSFRFELDNPVIVCHFCGEMRDAISGKVLRAGRTTEESR
jgi:hypothetical protein